MNMQTSVPEAVSSGAEAATVRHAAVADLLRSEPVTPEAVERFLSENAFPLVEPGAATFAWHGEAERVELVRWILAGGERKPFARVPGTDLWLLRLPVEDGGRFEYKLALIWHDNEELRLDPLNPARAGDPFGENSVCRTWGYSRPRWSLAQGAPAGRIETVDVGSDAFDETRHERIICRRITLRIDPTRWS